MVKYLAALSLVGVLILGGALRLPGLWWSLPNPQHPMLTYHPDEGSMLAILSHMNPATGDFNPNWFHYPHFHFYTLGAAMYGAKLTGKVTLASDEAFYQTHPWETAKLYLVGRGVSLGYAMATMVLLFLWAAWLGRPMWGVLAALGLALLPVHVIHSSFMTVDVALTFWCTLAMALLGIYVSQPKSNFVMGLAIFAVVGVAAAVKYTALLLLLPVWVGLYHKGDLSHIFSVLTSRRVWAGYGVLALVFMLLSPYVILDFKHSLPSITGLYSAVVVSEQESSSVPFAVLYHLLFSLPTGWGIPMMGMVVLSVIWALYRRQPMDWVCVVWVLGYILIFSYPQEKYLRYLLPVAPVTCLMAARLVYDLWVFSERRPFKAVVALGVTAVFVMTFFKSLAYALMLKKTDVRDMANAWIIENISQGSAVTLFALPYAYHPPVFYEFEDKGWGLYRPSTRYDLAVVPRIPSGRLKLTGDYFVLTEYDFHTAMAFGLNPKRQQLFVDRAFYNRLFSADNVQMVFSAKHRARLGPFEFDSGYVPEDWLYINPQQIVLKRVDVPVAPQGAT